MNTIVSAVTPLVVLNPAANRGNVAAQRAAIQSMRAQYAFEYQETQAAGDAQRLAAQAADQNQPIIIVGGDGAINEVVNGVLGAGKRIPIGIVPAGSGNDYACEALRIPKDPAAALKITLEGRELSADAGKVNGRYFAGSFSVGLDADIAFSVSFLKKTTPLQGSLLYYIATLRQLVFGYGACPWLKISIDGVPISATAERYVMAAITNGPTYGAGFRINPTADPADGLFNICAISYTPLLKALQVLPVVQKGKHEHLKEVKMWKATKIRIEGQRQMNGQTDGEVFRDQIFEAELLPAALLVRVP